jgi:hypothetical protein
MILNWLGLAALCMVTVPLLVKNVPADTNSLLSWPT